MYGVLFLPYHFSSDRPQDFASLIVALPQQLIPNQECEWLWSCPPNLKSNFLSELRTISMVVSVSWESMYVLICKYQASLCPWQRMASSKACRNSIVGIFGRTVVWVSWAMDHPACRKPIVGSSGCTSVWVSWAMDYSACRSNLGQPALTAPCLCPRIFEHLRLMSNR